MTKVVQISWAVVGILLGNGCTPAVDDVASSAPAEAVCATPAYEGQALAESEACRGVHLPTADRLDDALAMAGLDRCSLGYSDSDVALFPPNIVADPERLPFYDRIWKAPLNAVPFASNLTAEIDAALSGPHPVASAIVAAASRLGYAPASCTAAAAIPPGDQPLADAVAELTRARGAQPDVAALAADGADVPLELQRALVPVLRALATAAAARDEAVGRLEDEELRAAFASTPQWPMPAGVAVDDFYLEILQGDRLDYALLYQGAADLALAIEHAGLSAYAGSKGFSFRADTPLGAIIVSDASSQTLEPPEDGGGAVAFLLDTGGDDVYRAQIGATVDGEHGVSVAIDLGGADSYGYPELVDPNDGARLPSDGAGRVAPSQYYGPYTNSSALRQGAASLGIAFLFDLGPEADHYQSLRASQGFGALGVGVLYDAGGDDRYALEAEGQGAGVFGIGLLLDAGGADEYRTYTVSQGFGFVRGAGFLVDGGAGSDRYFAEPTDPLYYSPQIPGQANSSFVQGAGFGRRDDQGGHYMSGGLGLLRDQGGDDIYVASVFGQGVGYWFGTGILSDAGGDDTYDGFFYVQGAAAHFSSGIFLDQSGSDQYNANLLQVAESVGIGNDFAVGIHIDRGGDDAYHVHHHSLGTGNSNGVGLLVNVGGDDAYHSVAEPALPAADLPGIAAGDIRETRPTTGIFLDVGGTDAYDVGGSPVTRGDEMAWVNNRRSSAPSTFHSAGLDVADGAAEMP